jgi:hypothetical protein
MMTVTDRREYEFARLNTLVLWAEAEQIRRKIEYVKRWLESANADRSGELASKIRAKIERKYSSRLIKAEDELARLYRLEAEEMDKESRRCARAYHPKPSERSRQKLDAYKAEALKWELIEKKERRRLDNYRAKRTALAEQLEAKAAFYREQLEYDDWEGEFREFEHAAQELETEANQRAEELNAIRIREDGYILGKLVCKEDMYNDPRLNLDPHVRLFGMK